MQTRLPLVLVIDFDGTVTDKDIGDELCARFCPPEWRAIDDAWVRNEITLPEAQRRMWTLCRAEKEEAIAYARTVGQRRPGLGRLLSVVSQLGGEVWLASGGFDFYVEALLGDESAAFSRRYYNATRFAAGGIEVSFPHTELHCDRCAVCKGKVCDQAKARAERVIFVGDGSSDRCVVGRCDEIFAVRGGILDRHCEALGAAAERFETFDQVSAAVARSRP